MKKTVILLMIITIVSKLFGFAREIILSYFYGASNISDAYLVATTIPMTLISFVATWISTGYIPTYSNIEQNYGVEEANKYTNNIVNIMIIICTFIIIGGLLFTTQIVKIFASGFIKETLNLTVTFTKISLLGLYFTSLIVTFTSFLQLKGNYAVPALIAFPMNLIIILSIIMSAFISHIALPIGIVIAAAAQLFILIPFIIKKGYRYKFILDIKDERIKTMAYIALPVIVGVSANQINILVDKSIASIITIGGISALNYAGRLNAFVQGIFVLSISTVMYPVISKMAAEDNMLGLKKSVRESISGINLLVIPTTIGAMIFSGPVVKLLFGRGAFDIRAISMTSYALFFYSVGMIGIGLREVLSRAFYSLQDTKTPMINACIAVIMNIILNIILSKFMGIGGLALATSISAIFCTGLLFISLRKKIGSFGLKTISISFIKILFASSIMGIIAKLTYNVLLNNLSANLSLVSAIGIGALTYFFMISFMKIEDVDIIINAVKRKIRVKAAA